MTTSSIKDQPKKMGAGGSYTWGSPLDTSTYYEPSGITSSVGVVLSPAPALAAPVVATQSIPVIQDTQAFPVLGSSTVPVVSQSWGPGVLTSSPQPMTVASLSGTVRTGSIDIVDAQHPRNLFAKKPTIRPASVPTAIDWSSTGMPVEVMQSILKANPAHTSPYVQAAPSTLPLDVLRTRNSASQAAYINFTPKLDYQYAAKVNQTQRANRVIHQPQKR